MKSDKFIRLYLPHGGGDQVPTRVIIHAMAEYIDLDATTAARFGLEAGPLHALHYLMAAKLSAHALITPAGDVLLTRDPSLQAWHALDHNQDTLGVEFLVPGAHGYAGFLEAIADDYLTAAAYSAGIDLVGDWLDNYSISDITTHQAIDPDRKQDPGAGFPFQRFIEDL